jgi:hypothetical protein
MWGIERRRIDSKFRLQPFTGKGSRQRTLFIRLPLLYKTGASGEYISALAFSDTRARRNHGGRCPSLCAFLYGGWAWREPLGPVLVSGRQPCVAGGEIRRSDVWTCLEEGKVIHHHFTTSLPRHDVSSCIVLRWASRIYLACLAGMTVPMGKSRQQRFPFMENGNDPCNLGTESEGSNQRRGARTPLGPRRLGGDPLGPGTLDCPIPCYVTLAAS